MPLQVVGKRAEEHVTSDSIIGLVVDGPYFELHGLETAERLLDQAQLFIGGDYFASSHLLFGHLTTNNVTAVEEFFGHDLVLVKAPGEPSIEHIPADEFTHLGTLQHLVDPFFWLATKRARMNSLIRHICRDMWCFPYTSFKENDR